MTTTSHQAQTYPFGPAERLQIHPRYAELRHGQPLARVTMPFGGDGWLATRYEDIKTVMTDPRFSTAATATRDTPRVSPVSFPPSSILLMDPPDHTRLRRLASKAFTIRQVEQLRPRTQAIVDDLLDNMIKSGQPADLSSSLAWPLTMTVVCDMLGVPDADQAEFQAWTDTSFGLAAGAAEEVGAALGRMHDYLAGLIAQRRIQPADDLLSALVAAKDNDEQLGEPEIITLGVTLLAAGHETTANELGNCVYTLLSQPKYWAQLVAEPDLVPVAVEELLRYIPLFAAGGFPRIATEDVELGGQLVPAGDAVVVVLHSGNRDESIFSQPDELNFSREEKTHLAFGHGIHHCLGSPLARMELQTAIATLIRRLPTLRLAVPAEEIPWRLDRLTRGVLALPVAW